MKLATFAFVAGLGLVASLTAVSAYPAGTARPISGPQSTIQQVNTCGSGFEWRCRKEYGKEICGCQRRRGSY